MSAPEPGAALLRSVARAVRERGWAVVFGPFGEHPVQYGYTVGLTETFGYPEAIIIGLGKDLTTYLLAELARRLSAGERPPLHSRIDLGLNFPLAVHPVPAAASQEHMWATAAHHAARGSSYEAVQLVWPDQAGVFPWESGHRIAGNYQPLLSTAPPPH